MKFATFCTVLFWLWLISTNAAMGQKVIVSEPEDINMRVDDFAVIGPINEYLAVYRKYNGKAEVILYSPFMRKFKTISLTSISANFSRIYFASNGESIAIFYQQREQKNEQLYALTIGKDYIINPPVLLTSIPTQSSVDNIYFERESSADHSIHFLYTSYMQGGARVVKSVTLTQQLQILSTTEQAFADKDNYIAETAAIGNSGNAYLLMSDKPSSKGLSEQLKLLQCSPGSNVWIPLKIELGKHAVGELKLAMNNPSHTLYVAGYYGESRYTNATGVFHLTYSEENNIMVSTIFSPLTLTMNSGTGKNDLRDIKLRHVSLRKDGGIEFVGERFTHQMRTISSMAPVMMMNNGFMPVQDNVRSVHEYVYDEILIISLKEDGLPDWQQRVLKEQISNDDGGIYASFGVLEHSLGKAYFFNDNSNRRTRLKVAYINGDSEMSIKEIQLGEDISRWNLMPRSAKQVSSTEIIVPCVSKNYLCFLKISY